MIARLSPHTRAVLQALFVTVLWSSSWVLIKVGLEDLPALTFAGLRYTLAAVVLIAFAARRGELVRLRALSARDWWRLIALGLLFYTATQGGMFLALDRLPAMTTSLLFSMTPAVVAVLGIGLLGEGITRQQWGGMGVYLLGAVLYFGPNAIPAGEEIGLLFALGATAANALATILGRAVNRTRAISPLAVTVVSMFIGSVVMLAAGIAVQGLPAISAQNAAIIVWLAVINTALAFTLWNLAQRTLPAVEVSIIANTMTVQIAVLAWVFLGETLNGREIAGLALAVLGVLIVQVRRAAVIKRGTPAGAPVGGTRTPPA